MSMIMPRAMPDFNPAIKQCTPAERQDGIFFRHYKGVSVKFAVGQSMQAEQRWSL